MRIFKWAIGIVSLAVLVAVGGGYLYLTASQPDYQAKLTGPVSAPVKIWRDDWGVPFISAANEADAAFAVGYCMAQDRLFQMDLLRRAATGRLAEIMGPDLVAVDKFQLMLGAYADWPKEYNSLPADIKLILDRFSAGVNQYIDQGNSPPEFTALGYRPEPWRPADCLGLSLILGWDLSSAWPADLVAYAIAQKLGPDKLKDYFPDYPADAPTILPAAAGAQDPTVALAFLEAGLKARQAVGLNLAAGSNSWVVSGARSTTGKPILANDPHLGLNQPPIWWEATLEIGDFKLSGVFLPGAPLPMIGFNDRIAWGLTNVAADDADFFIETIHPDKPTFFKAEDNYKPARLVKRTIKVKDGQPVEITFRLTDHGVIINDVAAPDYIGGQTMSLRWTGQERPSPAEAVYRVSRAKDWSSFRRALSIYEFPGQNFIYADIDGHIGYVMGCRLPVRGGENHGLLPTEAASGRNNWQGYVAYAEQPYLFDPPEGFIATANNKIVGDDYPHYITNYWAGPDRIVRIRELIAAKPKLSVRDMAAMQMDVLSIQARRITPLILAACDGANLEPAAQRALAALKKWDYRLTAQSTAASVFEMTYVRLFREIFSDELGELFPAYLKVYYLAAQALNQCLDRDRPLIDDAVTPITETKDDILRRAFLGAVRELSDRLETENVDLWQWGKIHTIKFGHPFGQASKLMDSILSLGPYGIGGGMFTVNPLSYRLSDEFTASAGASMRQIVDLSDLNESLRIITSGQCGHFMSDHYADQVQAWLTGQLRPVGLDREQHKAGARYFMEITPSGGA